MRARDRQQGNGAKASGLRRALCAAAAALLLSGATASAEEASFALVMRGLTAGTLTWSGSGGPGQAYGVSGTLQTTGIAAMLRRVRYDAQVQGAISKDGVVRPQRYSEDADTGKRQSSSVMTWSGGVPRIASYKPERPPRPYDVEARTQKGAVDPLTALFVTLRDAAPGQECNISLRLFDGRRATQLVVGAPKAQGGKVICAGEYRRLAGFSDEDMAEKTRFPFTLTLQQKGAVMQVTEVSTDTIYGKARLVRR